MGQYKFFSISDKKREAIGKVYASNIESAFIKASRKKGLSLEQFKELFNLEEV